MVHAVSQESVRWTGCGEGIKQQNKAGEVGWLWDPKRHVKKAENESESRSVVSDSL